jgi:putative effector of murein hydrolase
MNPLANPVLIAVTILVLLLTLTATSYETYQGNCIWTQGANPSNEAR